MDFKSRFKGKCSVMNKEGVIGIIKQTSLPIAKERGSGYYTDYELDKSDDRSPLMKRTDSSTQKETRSQVFTNMQKKPSERKKFGNIAESIVYNEYSHLPIKLQKDFNQINMDEYQIVALPKSYFGNLNDRYAMTHSFAPQHVTQPINTTQGPLIKTYNNEKEWERGNYNTKLTQKKYSEKLQNAGLGSLRYNGYSKK